MNDIIKLPSRYGIRTFLKRIPYDDNNKVYLLSTEASTIRVIYKNSEKSIIQAIDPSGGPYLNVGSIIEKNKIKKIEFLTGIGWLIKF